MSKNVSGRVRKGGGRIWDVVDPGGNLVARFDNIRFPQIPNGIDVYFIDYNLDKVCDNVQAKTNVDDRITLARPQNGFTNDAGWYLWNYIMEALQSAFNPTRSAQSRTQYLNNLDAMMKKIKVVATAHPSKRVSLSLLKGVIQTL
jgi:hypothetical protein